MWGGQVHSETTECCLVLFGQSAPRESQELATPVPVDFTLLHQCCTVHEEILYQGIHANPRLSCGKNLSHIVNVS